MTPQKQVALELLDARMLEATGHTYDRYQWLRKTNAGCLDKVKLYGTLIDESGVVELIDKWKKEDRRSGAGRKPLMTHRAVLILFLMHMDDGDSRYDAIATTLYARTTPEVRDYLELGALPGDRNQWYQRYCQALNRILDLMEPWDIDKRKHATAEEFIIARATYLQKKRDRADELMNALVRASVCRLPADIRARYRGNVGIDGTPLKLVGRANPSVSRQDSNRFNLDAMSGPYTREGNHKGQGKRSDEPAWEVETVTTLPNDPANHLSFPVLTTGVTMHEPGRSKYGPLIAVRFHTRLFLERGYLIGDRAYNGFKAWRFQVEIRKMGFYTVWHFKKKYAGKQASIGDAIQVDGNLYLRWMPKDLVTATPDWLAGLIDDETYYAHLAARSKYRLTEKGRPDADGFHRYTYPTIARDMMLIDPATDKVVRGNPLQQKTLQFGPDTSEGMRIIKNLQNIEYRTLKWRAFFGMRNRVEENNNWFKGDNETDIGNPEKRRAVGYAYNALCAGAAVSVSNMRRIVEHVHAEALETVDRKDVRARRRTDIDGKPLERLEFIAA